MVNNIDNINELLPLHLIQPILLRLAIKNLVRFRSVSKLWNSLISDPNFAKSHFELSHASPTDRCLFIQSTSTKPLSADLDLLFNSGDYGGVVKDVSLPPSIKKKPPTTFQLLGSCRGFIALQLYSCSFFLWNPLTRSHKSISYSHVVRNSSSVTNGNSMFTLVSDALLFGFGYEASQDDYLVVLAWRNEEKKEDRLNLFSLRTNLWNSFEVSLPIPLTRNMQHPGLFLNGAIHWLRRTDNDTIAILVFDMTQRSFSWMPMPKQVEAMHFDSHLMVLGGCLSLYHVYCSADKIKIWIMKEYKVQSSWILYKVPSIFFEPICLSSRGDIIGFDFSRVLAKYNVKGELLQYFGDFAMYTRYIMYTESLLQLPNDSE